MPDTERRTLPAPGSRPSGWRGLGIVALYALLGPLIGALAANVTLLALTLATDPAATGAGWQPLVGALIGGSIFAVVLGYPVGLAPALVVGLAVAWAAREGQAVSWRIALVSALAVAALLILAVLFVTPPAGQATGIAALTLGCLLATAGCTALARALFPPRRVVN